MNPKKRDSQGGEGGLFGRGECGEGGEEDQQVGKEGGGVVDAKKKEKKS